VVGLTCREGLKEDVVCWKPSDHVRWNGGVPASVACSVTFEPTQIEVLPPVTVAAGGGDTLTARSVLAEHEFFVTVTEIWAGLSVPTLKVTAEVPWPPVIVP